MHLGKPICAPPHLRSFPNDASESETVPVLVWLMITFHVLHRTSSITFFFHASVLQVTDGVMTFVLCLNIVSQAPQQMLATFDDCFAHQSFWLDVSLYSSISGAVHEGGSRTLSHTLTFCLPFHFSFSLSLSFFPCSKHSYHNQTLPSFSTYAEGYGICTYMCLKWQQQ